MGGEGALGARSNGSASAHLVSNGVLPIDHEICSWPICADAAKIE